MATLFERIVARELPADIVYQDAEITAFRDIHPRAPVHILIVPNKAIPTANDIADAEGFEAECRQGRQLGFDGKTLIHPSQLEPCNRVFAPAADEVERAGHIIEAFEQAQAEGRGVVTVDGRMVENLHVEQAHRTLALAAAIAGLEGG